MVKVMIGMNVPLLLYSYHFFFIMDFSIKLLVKQLLVLTPGLQFYPACLCCDDTSVVLLGNFEILLLCLGHDGLL